MKTSSAIPLLAYLCPYSTVCYSHAAALSHIIAFFTLLETYILYVQLLQIITKWVKLSLWPRLHHCIAFYPEKYILSHNPQTYLVADLMWFWILTLSCKNLFVQQLWTCTCTASVSLSSARYRIDKDRAINLCVLSYCPLRWLQAVIYNPHTHSFLQYTHSHDRTAHTVNLSL